MNKNLTDITLVVDRSGSMHQIREDAEGGINSFIAEQGKQPGEALLTLVQFDTEFEFVHRGMPLPQVPKFELVPRGSTALLDAVGTAIRGSGERLASMNEPDRPGLVIFVIVTDGMENSSHQFTRAQIKEMIQHQQQTYAWQFIFLGANQDAFAEAGQIGIDRFGAAPFDVDKVAATYGAVGQSVKRMRRQRCEGQPVVNEFTQEERDAMS